MRLAVLVGSVLISNAVYATRESSASSALATSVTGIVFDSLVMRGLAGATVQLVTSDGLSSSRLTKTDPSGRFAFEDVPRGVYLLGFFHPKLDSLNLTSESQHLDIRTDQPIQTQLSVPSGRTITRKVCGASFVTESSGLLLGYVRGADNTMPRAGGIVIVRWAELVIAKGSIQRVISSTNAVASPTGLFAACGVPLGSPLLLRASAGPESSGAFEVTVPSSGFLHRDVFVAPVTRTIVRSLDSVPDVELLEGSGRLRGQVWGSNRRPVAGARVHVWATRLEATSNDVGEFSLSGLPEGTHTLEVRAIGFSPAQIPVDILEGHAGAAEVELANVAVTLDTVRVTAQRLYASRRLLDMERRARMGMGHIYGANELNKRNPFVLTDVLRMVPGIHVVPGRFSDAVVVRDRRGFGFCRPEFIVDNVRMMVDDGFPVNWMVQMNDVLAVEVYTTVIPAEFMSRTQCGMIVVTTGGRPPRAKR